MNSVFYALSYLAKLGAVLKVFKIFLALPKLYRFGKNFGAIAGDLLRKGELPNGEESQKFLRSMADLMRLGIVDFPNINEDEIAQQLETMAAELEDPADEAKDDEHK